MGLKSLAEGIILQSIEDLWDETLKEESVAFFSGSDFSLCAEIAGLKLSDQIALLGIVKDVTRREMKRGSRKAACVSGKQRRHQKWQGDAVAPCA